MGTKWNDFLGLDRKVPSALNESGVPVYFIDDIKNCKIVDIPQIEWNSNYNHPVIVDFIKKYECFSMTEDQNILLRTAPGRGMQIDWQYYLNNDLREKYDFARQKNPVVYHGYSTFINVGIHIRRGDINPKDQPERWITNNQYIRLMQNIVKVYGDNCLFHIYSEGAPSDFKDVLDSIGLSVVLHLQDDPIVAFHNLVLCDILVNAKSAFSVCAAYFHKGPKLCIPFSVYWQETHPNNDNFKDLTWVNDNMDFNNEKIKSYFS